MSTIGCQGVSAMQDHANLTTRIHVRFTVPERAAIRKMAETAGMNESQFVRFVVRGFVAERKKRKL